MFQMCYFLGANMSPPPSKASCRFELSSGPTEVDDGGRSASLSTLCRSRQRALWENSDRQATVSLSQCSLQEGDVYPGVSISGAFTGSETSDCWVVSELAP